MNYSFHSNYDNNFNKITHIIPYWKHSNSFLYLGFNPNCLPGPLPTSPTSSPLSSLITHFNHTVILLFLQELNTSSFLSLCNTVPPAPYMVPLGLSFRSLIHHLRKASPKFTSSHPPSPNLFIFLLAFIIQVLH